MLRKLFFINLFLAFALVSAPAAQAQDRLARVETNSLNILFVGGEQHFTIAVTPKTAESKKPFKAEAFTVDNPARLVIDVSNHSVAAEKKLELKHEFFKSIRLGVHPNKTRLVIDIRKDRTPDYTVSTDTRLQTAFVDFSFPDKEIPLSKPEETEPAVIPNIEEQQEEPAVQEEQEETVEEALYDYGDAPLGVTVVGEPAPEEFKNIAKGPAVNTEPSTTAALREDNFKQPETAAVPVQKSAEANVELVQKASRASMALAAIPAFSEEPAIPEKLPAAQAEARASLISGIIDDQPFTDGEKSLRLASLKKYEIERKPLPPKKIIRDLSDVTRWEPISQKKTSLEQETISQISPRPKERFANASVFGKGIRVNKKGIITNIEHAVTPETPETPEILSPPEIDLSEVGKIVDKSTFARVTGINYTTNRRGGVSSIMIEIDGLSDFALVELGEAQYQLTLNDTIFADQSLISPIHAPSTIVGHQSIVPRQLETSVILEIDVEKDIKLTPTKTRGKLWLRGIQQHY